jgi:hypothetical protein
MLHIRDDIITDSENYNSTYKITRLGLINSALDSSSKFVIDRSKFTLSQDYYKQQIRENLEIAEFTTSVVSGKYNEQEVYTNPLRKTIKTNLLSFSPLFSEVSNKVINTNYISLLNNFLNYIQNIYILKNPVEILKFLNEEQDLVYLLLDAANKIREVFNDEKVSLKVSYDPEIVEWKKLIINIHTNLDADEAFDKLKMLDNNWWSDVSFDFGKYLDINIDFDEI